MNKMRSPAHCYRSFIALLIVIVEKTLRKNQYKVPLFTFFEEEEEEEEDMVSYSSRSPQWSSPPLTSRSSVRTNL
jgi:hypothetical protein